MKTFLTNRQLIVRITLGLLLSSIVFGLLFSLYLKKIALQNLAGQDAKKNSEYIFEIMNTKMQEGWAKDDLSIIMQRLNTMQKGLVIRSYRSEKVEEIFGADPQAQKSIQSDVKIQQALEGEKVLSIGEDDSVRYLYPIPVRKQCITCHYNMVEGEINGVLDIYYPADEITIPLNVMIIYFIFFLVIFLIVVFSVFYFVLNTKIVKPLIRFTDQMQRIADENDLDKRIVIQSQISEISRIGAVFNELLDTIKFYYDKVLGQLYIDALTSLPNQPALKRDIVLMEEPTLIILNIDQFKGINDFYGHTVGDHLLVELTKKLTTYLGKDDRLYRLGSDEFVWLKSDFLDLYVFLDLLEQLSQHPFRYENSEIILSYTCGIATGEERVLEHAKLALQAAKDNCRPFEVYDHSMMGKEDHEQNIYWTAELKEALQEERIITYFQPILDVSMDRAQKFETLVRMRGKDGTIYSPFHFMKVAKLSKLYLRMTRSVAKQAFSYFEERPYAFSINISIEDIADQPTKDYLIKRLNAFPEPQRVIFEILETEEITEFELMDGFVQEVKAAGGKIAIDDFGSGYSNYSYVLRLDVDYLKIDSSLIKDIDSDPQAEIVVESIVESAKRLGLKTVAEFVHSKSVMDKVMDIGVDFVQGYYIDPPLASVEEHLGMDKR